MNHYRSSVSWLVTIILTITLTLSPFVASASPLSDLIGQTINNTTSDSYKGASGGNSLMNTLLALLIGKFFKNTPDHSSLDTKNKPLSKELVGFYAEWWGADTSSLNSFTKNSDVIKTIAPFWATLRADGTLLDRGGNDHPAVVEVAHRNNAAVLLLVNNAKPTQGTTPIHTLLTTPALRTTAITNLETYIKKYNLDGINVDFEMVDAADRDYLSAFMKELSERLKPQGYIISMDVFPKQDETNDVAIAYDYEQLAKYVDKIMIMTYDNHGTWSDAGPIADIRWVEKNLNYALQFIPKNKLYLGIAAYGYDWSSKGVDSLEYSAVTALAARYHSPILWDTPSKSPHFSYITEDGISHQVWYENKDSLKYKLELVNKYDLAGAALWKLGEEDPASWSVLREYFAKQ